MDSTCGAGVDISHQMSRWTGAIGSYRAIEAPDSVGLRANNDCEGKMLWVENGTAPIGVAAMESRNQPWVKEEERGGDRRENVCEWYASKQCRCKGTHAVDGSETSRAADRLVLLKLLGRSKQGAVHWEQCKYVLRAGETPK